MKLKIVLFGILTLLGDPARADTFGNGGNIFTIEFVEIGNAGNGVDSGDGGGIYFSSYNQGAVPYPYLIGKYEISQNVITKATASGLQHVTASPWQSDQPAGQISWYEAAAFVNWLNTSTGHHVAYDLTWSDGGGEWTMNAWSPWQAWRKGGENLFRHKHAYYFLPSLDEWYKAAFHKNDGSTANYWDYATGSNEVPIPVASGTNPGTAVYGQLSNDPAEVDNAGGTSAYGTMGQGGNVPEWQETEYAPQNVNPQGMRNVRGGGAGNVEQQLRSEAVNYGSPTNDGINQGFRVARIFDTDTDGDTIFDQFETATGIYVSPEDTGTDPNKADSDGDGITDGEELDTYHSNPNMKDTDNDDWEDGFEVSTGFDPASPMSSPDSLSSIRTAVEYRFNAALDISYRIESSTDLTNWTILETPILGAGGVITRFFSIEGQERRYFRSRRN